jgi:hypothetical protein
MVKSIDITKIQPTNWRYIAYLVLAVVVILAAIFIGQYLWGFVQGYGEKAVSGVSDVI